MQIQDHQQVNLWKIYRKFYGQIQKVSGNFPERFLENFPNVFWKIYGFVSEKSFSRINAELNNRGFIVEEIDYSEISKMEGLFRCSTIPIIRR